MSQADKTRQLADRIAEILAKGITLSDDVVHYIDSTFSNPSTKELQMILQDDSNCERDPLSELLFFPGESMQAQLEEYLETFRPQPRDEREVFDCLCRSCPTVCIRFPDGREPLNIAMRDSEISQLISRLKLCKHLDANLIAAVNRHVADDLKSIAKVRLRNARFVPADNKLGFLVKLFEKMPSENEHFVECLDFALGFLDEQQNDPDIFPALMRKKKFYYKTLQKALKFESQLNRSNMETLMLQGKRAAFVDKNEARKNMRIIDIISRAVFGKTEYYDRLDVHGEVFEQNTCRDIDDIIHMFSDPEDSGP